MYLVADAGNSSVDWLLVKHLFECESNTYPVIGQNPLHELFSSQNVFKSQTHKQSQKACSYLLSVNGNFEGRQKGFSV